MWIFKFYTVSKFQWYNILLLAIVTMFSIRSSDIIHPTSKSLYTFMDFFLLPVPGNQLSMLSFYEFHFCNIPHIKWHPTPVLLPGKSHGRRSLVGCSPWGHWESDTTERLHFHFHALEKEMATHSSVLAWRIPGMGEPGGLPSMGSHRVRHDWGDLAAATAA